MSLGWTRRIVLPLGRLMSQNSVLSESGYLWSQNGHICQTLGAQNGQCKEQGTYTKACRFNDTTSNARMAKLADAADLKSADLHRSWGFKSPSGHHRVSGLRKAEAHFMNASTSGLRLNRKGPN